MNIKWPKTITNENVYEITKVKPWSTLIKIRRLRWFGHAIRLPNDTPVKIVISYAKEQYKRCRGRPITTWVQMVTKQLENELKITWDQASEMATDRNTWQKQLKRYTSALYN